MLVQVIKIRRILGPIRAELRNGGGRDFGWN
jgi:hypothetical protein